MIRKRWVEARSLVNCQALPIGGFGIFGLARLLQVEREVLPRSRVLRIAGDCFAKVFDGLAPASPAVEKQSQTKVGGGILGCDLARSLERLLRRAIVLPARAAENFALEQERTH